MTDNLGDLTIMDIQIIDGIIFINGIACPMRWQKIYNDPIEESEDNKKKISPDDSRI